jgi:hypothetical protein
VPLEASLGLAAVPIGGQGSTARGLDLLDGLQGLVWDGLRGEKTSGEGKE